MPIVWLLACLVLNCFVQPHGEDQRERMGLYLNTLIRGQELIMLVLMFVLACFSLPRERERRTIITTGSKPISRLELIVGKIMGFALLGDTDRAWDLFALVNPIHHGASPGHIATYKVEPYVVAADVYAVAPHTGRGGWTWYTGSAGWMYRLLIETLIGLNLEGDHLRLAPSLPRSWTMFTVHYRYRKTAYHIHITRPPAGLDRGDRLTLDGETLTGNRVPLLDDGREHFVEMQLG